MSLFECILVYAVSWWLVLFMVLPWGAHPPAQPEVGHAPSAPANPRLKQKLLITSVLALFVPLIAWSISEARAVSGIYHAGSNDCAPLVEYQGDASINAVDGQGADGSPVAPATLGGDASANQFEHVPTFLDAPASDYTNNQQLNDKLGAGVVQLGVINTNTKTGETTLNGQRIGGAHTLPSHCTEKAK